ncbi:CBS domain-containing protein [Sphingobacterium allocomposti]|uniref:CBS domain-containing protein n=1 Tax=Sphingobacterium allocomposti TaxID=415956 RepID=A0A5S5DPV9_9SPHI|nr:CBS domain-containing protein [Sphingobacterium composti Yoo et al. 2007 non Ten et al. 2007]TYP97755.1 CBS domain-containing protein [Sphingobacterium composti Yoo et al. 2007 non Ten et al. 2007]HLS96321.1 CBS domain-containing protein [Sphingobacterium sp.]
MYIGEILAKNYFDVKSDDSISFTLDKMNELHTSQLPVVNGRDFLGVIAEDHLLAAHDDTHELHSLMVSLRFVYLYEYQHVYDALQYMSAHQLEVLPILDKENNYVGVVTLGDLLSSVNETLSNKEPGAIIVLELGKNDVSFSHIAHIFESENIRILNAAVRDIPNTTKIEMTIKVDKQNISTLVASLWRFDYVVKATFNDGSQDSDIKERYDILMNYLNL